MRQPANPEAPLQREIPAALQSLLQGLENRGEVNRFRDRSNLSLQIPDLACCASIPMEVLACHCQPIGPISAGAQELHHPQIFVALQVNIRWNIVGTTKRIRLEPFYG